MAEEFLESEVIFSDPNYNFPAEMVFAKTNNNQRPFRDNHGKSRGKKRNKKKSSSSASAPIKIPENVLVCGDSDEFEEEYDDGDLVPPHVILARRIAGKMAFSVCTGNGRTLKGRDLSQVRNSILRMTGFLEA